MLNESQIDNEWLTGTRARRAGNDMHNYLYKYSKRTEKI